MSPFAPPRIVDVIFAVSPRRPRWIVPFAVVVALGAHVVIWRGAVAQEPTLEAWSAALAARVHSELRREELVELPTTSPRPPAPSPPAEAAPPPASPTAPSSPAKATRVAPVPSSPAQAGRIIAQAPSPEAPADLTGDTFVEGAAERYAGGVTSPSGRSERAVPQLPPATTSSPPTARAPVEDRSSTVELTDEDWSCPWPKAADRAQIDEQAVIVKVLVRADGSAEAARALGDPGYGFAEAARSCALGRPYLPARDRRGDPIRAESPPIRVRFTR